ncbi:MAG: hypothetical protein ACRCTR_05655 [Actinomycetota bacterium]
MQHNAHPAATATELRLFAEAAAKSPILWLRPGQETQWYPAWHIWHADAVWVVTGPGEQTLPLLTDTTDVLIRSKETGMALVCATTTTRRIQLTRVSAADQPTLTDEWASGITVLASARLNSDVAPDQLVTRWHEAGNDVARLTPLTVNGPLRGNTDTGNGATQTVTTPATPRVRLPWHWGRRR